MSSKSSILASRQIFRCSASVCSFQHEKKLDPTSQYFLCSLQINGWELWTFMKPSVLRHTGQSPKYPSILLSTIATLAAVTHQFTHRAIHLPHAPSLGYP